MQIDPTQTKMLRSQYMRQLTRRFKVFKKHAVPSLLGIVDNYNNNFTFNRGLRKKTLRQTGFNQDIDSYLNWAIENDIIQPSHDIVTRNINQAYRKGAVKATKQLRLTYDYQIGENLTALDYEAMMELRDINFNLIKGATDAMKHNIQYQTTQGVLNGWGMDKIAYAIKKGINGNGSMGIVRAKMIARTEIINAYNVGAKKRYEQAGLTEKEMVWITTFDERTCETCAGYDGMTIARTGEIPPAHPNCRCAIAPLVK